MYKRQNSRSLHQHSPLNPTLPAQIQRLAAQISRSCIKTGDHADCAVDAEDERLLHYMQKAGAFRERMTPSELETLDVIEDHMPVKFCKMPNELNKMVWRLHCKHLSHSDRFQLTLFLLHNGVPPLLIAKWYVKRGMLHDLSARNSVADLIDKHGKGTLKDTYGNPYTVKELCLSEAHPDLRDFDYYVMDTKIETPDFATHPKFKSHWTLAIQILRNTSVNAQNVDKFVQQLPAPH